jgi:hypothetical protein
MAQRTDSLHELWSRNQLNLSVAENSKVGVLRKCAQTSNFPIGRKWKQRFFAISRRISQPGTSGPEGVQVPGVLQYWSSNDEYMMAHPCKRFFDLSQVVDIDQEGRCFSLKFRIDDSQPRRRELLTLCAESEQEAIDWFEALEKALAFMSAPIKFSVLKYPVVRRRHLDWFQALIDHCFIPKYTRDRKGARLPIRLQVVKVIKVQNAAVMQRYEATKAQIAASLSVNDHQEFRTILDPDMRTANCPGEPLAFPSMNRVLERLVFHGSTPEAIEAITNVDFDISHAGSHAGTLYGKGIYCAECSSKADEYTEEDEDGLRGLLLCRAALGRILYTDEAKPDGGSLQHVRASTGRHTVLGDRWRANGTYREFVFSDRGQVCPDYIIKYRRF